jgi:signal transduction histidine kinase
MPRSWPIWLTFAACTAAVIAALGWLSREMLQLDRAEAVARAQAATEEAVRLALWRMDSSVAALLAVESARPYFDYSSFYSPATPYGEMFFPNDADDVLMPSPLLAAPQPPIRLHFQLSARGEWTSPQAPRDARLAMAIQRGLVDRDATDRSRQALARLSTTAQFPALAARLPLDEPGPLVAVRPDEVPQQSAAYQGAQSPRYQELLNRADLQARQRFTQQSENIQAQQRVEIADDWTEPVRIGPFKALWQDGELLLVRRVALGAEEYLQGCWIDWAALHEQLRESVRDVLPDARLEPLPDDPADRPADRRLATLPARLDPGLRAPAVAVSASPLRASLVVAWVCVLLAISAVGALLAGALALSERRAAFVSAVTHELRTPLTTFRLYTELLAGGRVREESKQQAYFRTLDEEAQRLTHLVDNVLAYARLERGRHSPAAPPTPLRALLERAAPRLLQRAERAQQPLAFELDPRAAELCVAADPALVEQILLNLVDNACKYGANDGAAPIRIAAGAGAGPPPTAEVHATPGAAGRHAPRGQAEPRTPDCTREVYFAVRDAGPGVAPAEARRLFRAFHKSAQQAAHSAPGVGLGLALSRRLARSLGGDLRLAADGRPGACFVLTLPLAPPE